MAADTGDLLRWRSEFPILEKTVYLISNSLGAMPRGVRDALKEYADTWATRGVRAWGESWWEMPVNLGDLLGPILGCGPGEVSFHQNVTLAEAIVLSCFDFTGPRRKIVYTNMEFPSVMYLVQAQQARGAEICVVGSEDGISVDLNRLLEAIDERTLLVPVSHVLFKSAYIMDAQAIIRKAHEVGALVILDVYQSAGILPFDVKQLEVDFVIGGCLKWLCGGPGAAFLYVRPDLIAGLEPKLTGWMAHPNSFAFETGAMRYRDDAFRFLNGTPHIPCLYAARPGLEILGKIGAQRVRRNSMRQVAFLIELAREQGFPLTIPEKPEERGGTVAVKTPHAYEVSRELLRRDFIVDFRPGAGIRVSPHFYTSDEELEAVIREMRQIIDTRAYEKHIGRRSFVT
ncbi:MAG: aminotransferase class V-fold PLP-dependent enzyme [Acidobacteriia bacterium]|nr:aminotransferase class V-fold PLP-dependent enzyme [Terriglobia bacterium]